MERRQFVGAAALGLLGSCAQPLNTKPLNKGIAVDEIYGIIGQMKVAEGKRDQVIAALLKGTRNLPGNILYLIAEDRGDPNSIWITEVWESQSHHAASLQEPTVREAIAEAQPHITGFGTRVETTPVVS